MKNSSVCDYLFHTSEVRIQLMIALELLAAFGLAAITNRVFMYLLRWSLSKHSYSCRFCNRSPFTFGLLNKGLVVSSEEWQELGKTYGGHCLFCGTFPAFSYRKWWRTTKTFNHKGRYSVPREYEGVPIPTARRSVNSFLEILKPLYAHIPDFIRHQTIFL
jgi:hypothetical protein